MNTERWLVVPWVVAVLCLFCSSSEEVEFLMTDNVKEVVVVVVVGLRYMEVHHLLVVEGVLVLLTFLI